jgi:hypothetical protein
MVDKAPKKSIRRRRSGGVRGSFLSIFVLIAAIVFMPTTILLFFGMLPTVVAAVIDRTGKGIKALTVGSMNLAGCTPFLLELWTKGHTVDQAVILITDPRAVIVIYCAAGMGYLIDWTMSGIVKIVMVQRSQVRLKEIRKLQEGLIERWGREVVGDLPLDAYGFPPKGIVIPARQPDSEDAP